MIHRENLLDGRNLEELVSSLKSIPATRPTFERSLSEEFFFSCSSVLEVRYEFVRCIRPLCPQGSCLAGSITADCQMLTGRSRRSFMEVVPRDYRKSMANATRGLDPSLGNQMPNSVERCAISDSIESLLNAFSYFTVRQTIANRALSFVFKAISPNLSRAAGMQYSHRHSRCVRGHAINRQRSNA
jgi:hypothetical protein